MKIAVIVPTRGRPANAERLVDAFAQTVADPENTVLILGVDDDDPELEGYRALETRVTLSQGPRLRMAGTLNEIARGIADLYDIIGFMGDDHLPVTEHWDDRIRDAMTPGGIVYGNDLIQGPLLPTEVFLDARIVRKLNGFVPTGFTHLFLDNTWKLWGEQTGKLTYLPDVIIEHMHPLVGKAPTDDGYVEVNSGATWAADETRYREYVSNGELERDLEILGSIA